MHNPKEQPRPETRAFDAVAPPVSRVQWNYELEQPKIEITKTDSFNKKFHLFKLQNIRKRYRSKSTVKNPKIIEDFFRSNLDEHTKAVNKQIKYEKLMTKWPYVTVDTHDKSTSETPKVI